MLKILYIVFTVPTILLAGYSFISGATWTAPYNVLFLGITLLLSGIKELMMNKKGSGIALICVSIFSAAIAISMVI